VKQVIVSTLSYLLRITKSEPYMIPTMSSLVLLVVVAVLLAYPYSDVRLTASLMTIVFILFVVAGIWQFLNYLRVSRIQSGFDR
jgi:hypothetical protein